MDASTKTVLIVEDNELNMKLFHDLLDAHGYRILQTKDGMEALDIAGIRRRRVTVLGVHVCPSDFSVAIAQSRPMSSSVA